MRRFALLLLIICSVTAAVVIGNDDSADGETRSPTDAQFEQRAAALRESLPEGFTVVIARPFVVVGDESAAVVQRRADRTVTWAVEKLRAQYFEKDPDRIIDVYLFKDKAGYEKYCQSLFNIKPHTPYGFYSTRHDALIMNIATGGGTLVHEIVHPFVEANFPQCPAWFNEGLGSLYEQSTERDGRIVGLTNWRLAGLQKAIRADRLPPFKQLCDTTTHDFYKKDRGTNYAQARYLCYYLQEKGLLETFYHAFRESVDEYPSGYETLAATLGTDDMATFQASWEQWVLKLTFP